MTSCVMLSVSMHTLLAVPQVLTYGCTEARHPSTNVPPPRPLHDRQTAVMRVSLEPQAHFLELLRVHQRCVYRPAWLPRPAAELERSALHLICFLADDCNAWICVPTVGIFTWVSSLP